MVMRWSHSGSLEQIGMADKWKLSSKRLAVVLVLLQGGGADRDESQRLSAYWRGAGGALCRRISADAMKGF